MSNRLASAALAALLCACTAQITGKTGPGASKQAIVEGSAHSGDPAVLYLRYRSGSLCSGSLIAPRVVLTARHCVEGDAPTQVGTGSSVSAGTTYANVVDVRAPERLLFGDDGDIALLVLDRPGALEPYDWVRAGAPAIGELVIGVGYGDTDTSAGAAGQKRRGESRIGSMTPGEFTTDGPLSCHGDSGGPAFLRDGRVFGVVSRGTADRCSRGSTIYVRTDAHRAFIERVIADSGGEETPDRDVDVPAGDDAARDPADPPAEDPAEPPAGEPPADDAPAGEPGAAPEDPIADAPADFPGGGLCTDTCPWAGDGECDDGGDTCDWALCPYGSDCGDCGPRAASPWAPPGGGGGGGGRGCRDTCPWAFDGECDDGGPGADYAVCAPGTDCGDCGAR